MIMNVDVHRVEEAKFETHETMGYNGKPFTVTTVKFKTEDGVENELKIFWTDGAANPTLVEEK